MNMSYFSIYLGFLSCLLGKYSNFLWSKLTHLFSDLFPATLYLLLLV